MFLLMESLGGEGGCWAKSSSDIETSAFKCAIAGVASLPEVGEGLMES